VFVQVSVKAVLIAALVMSLAACSSPIGGPNLLESKLEDLPSSQHLSKKQRLENFIDNGGSQQPVGISKTGTGRFVANADGDAGAPPLSRAVLAKKGIRLNLVDVPVATAAKSVLGDVLEMNYSVDPRVQGKVTLQTSTPVNARELLSLFQGTLRDVDAGLVAANVGYRVVPLADAGKTVNPVVSGAENDTPGIRPEIVSLNYVSAAEIRGVIEPLIPAGMLVRADDTRNVLILSGTAAEVAAIKETIAVFDVDWMRGMSFSLVPVSSADPGTIVNNLQELYQTKDGPLRNLVRFIPNSQLKSVLIITSKPKYLREAEAWIKRLDRLAASHEQTLHVYHVQNRTAAELAKVLQSVLKSGGEQQTANAEVAPRLEPQLSLVPGTNPDTGDVVNGPETPRTGLGSTPELGTAAPVPAPAVSVTIANGDVRVVSDDANNSLLIFATDKEYKRILSVLQQVDSQPNQVLLEAVIAEVKLDDELKFGVKWLLGDSDSQSTFQGIPTSAESAAFAGFSYFLRANDIAFTLKALASVTDVRILSSPSLVVLDNKTATLQVGDQVPIITQRAQSTVGGNSPIVNNVELKDTGVILTVTPRVNDAGRVILDIGQEVSSVVATTTSGIDSPTIRQRKIKTTVVVTDGQALALGGLIQESEQTTKLKVPVLGDIPLLGNAFRQKTNTVGRTELIIFIRPRVIRDMSEAKRITREFQQELNIQAPHVRREDPQPGDELVRILQ
jgi:general secretion pathway protein D